MYGGTGQPVARGPHLAGVFSWAHEEDFLCGRRATLTSILAGRSSVLSQIGLSVIAMSLLTGWVDPEGRAVGVVFRLVAAVVVLGVVGVCVVTLAPLAMLGSSFVKALDGRRQAMEQGVLFLGQIRACEGQWGGMRVSNRSHDVFRVNVGWCLRLPDGRVLEQQSCFMRNDLGRGERPMPPPGAPVAVLVRSPTEFLVL